MIIASGSTALGVVVALAIAIPLVILAVICWIFWKARHDE